MFDMLDRPLLWIPVRWPGLKPGGPDGEGVAEAVENEIEVRVELKTQAEILAQQETIFAAETAGASGAQGLVDAVMLFATDWRKVVSGGQPLPFTRENVEAMLQHVPVFFDAFKDAYVQASLGRVETRQGNSDASPSDGPAGEAAPATTGNRKRRRTAAASGSTQPR